MKTKILYISLLLFCASLSAQNYQLNKSMSITISISPVNFNGVLYNVDFQTAATDWTVVVTDQNGYSVPITKLPTGLSIVTNFSYPMLCVQGSPTENTPRRQYTLVYKGLQCQNNLGGKVTRPSGLEFRGSTPIISTGTIVAIDKINDVQLNMYPNPVSNTLTISSADYIQNVSIFTISGKEVFNNNINALNTKINLTNFVCGMYLLKAKTTAGITIRTIIKNN